MQDFMNRMDKIMLLNNTQTTQRIIWPLTLIVIIFCLGACATQGTQENETADISADTMIQLPDSFRIFLDNFTQREFPARFPSNNNYDEGDVKSIDHALVKQFLSGIMFDYEFNNVYAVASMEIHAGLYSVVAYQVGEMGSAHYRLINYDATGKALSSREIAYYSNSGGMTGWSVGVLEKNGMLTITEDEEGKTDDHKNQHSYSYKIYATGAILPTAVPTDLITVFHNAVNKKGEYLVASRYGNTSANDVSSDAFRFYAKGDSIIFSPNDYSFDVNSPDEYDLIVDSFTKTSSGYWLTLKDEHYPHDEYDRLTRIKLNSVENKPGVYALAFTPASSDYAVITATHSELLISQPNLSEYKTRKLPFVDVKNQIWTEGNGVNGLLLGADRHEAEFLAKNHNLIYRLETELSEGETETYCRLYDKNSQLTIEALIDPQQNQITFISLYTPLFKTEGGICVGSTLEEILNAHERVSAVCGENSTIVSIPGYEHAQFYIDHIAGAPDTEIDIETLDKKLKISRIDFQNYSEEL
jgi:hypothetical protein